jgi:hypothetical protein
LVKEWPEVFEDLHMNTMPVAYLDMLRLEFNDGRIWEIDIQEQLKSEDPQTVADKLVTIFNDYKDELKKLDFKMDIDKLKQDIKESSKKLL